ncbi:hypothetical protein A4J19_26885 [Salmonella enterica subsp. enterica serovar Oranienburg]|uniref:Uncharacterized protein n=1 Tax=Salmonella enterica I TaxID=59201 RepID=A0A403MPL8_SALET|nr:hypothetical protein [Salmonella enterica subsp. enterica serovar Oranienburg]MLV00294.1 hypothetical protein [Salmonella enterica subsp. enterica serovar Oranienburg]
MTDGCRIICLSDIILSFKCVTHRQLLFNLSWSRQAHSAVADAVMTAGVDRDIAEYWCQLQREMDDN